MRPGPLRGPLAASALVAVLTAGLLGCSSGADRDDAAATTTGVTTTGVTSTGVTSTGAAGAVADPPSGPCISKMPGEPLSEDEARVRFSATGVCPSYVTVTVGTRVRWTNDHDAPVRVTLATAGPAAAGPAEAFAGTNPAKGGTTVFSELVDPGATFGYRPDRAGVYYVRLDLIPTFLGTLEVR